MDVSTVLKVVTRHKKTEQNAPFFTTLFGI